MKIDIFLCKEYFPTKGIFIDEMKINY